MLRNLVLVFCIALVVPSCASDSESPDDADECSDVIDGPLALPDAVIGLDYRTELRGRHGGVGHMLDGESPPGLQLANDVYLEGTPTVAGPFTFSVLSGLHVLPFGCGAIEHEVQYTLEVLPSGD